MEKQPDPIPPEGAPSPLAEGYLTAKEAAEHLGLSVEAVRAMCKDGSLTNAHFVRGRWCIPPGAIETWKQKQAEGTSSSDNGDVPVVIGPPASPHPVSGPPLWWQRFRNNPRVFYPITVVTGLIALVGVLFGLIQAGADVKGFYAQVKEWGLVREFPVEREGETLIVIARFYHSEGVADTEVHSEIRNAIQAAAQELGESGLRVDVSSVPIPAEDQERARKLGEKYDASIVIWGADTGVRVTVNFLNLKQPDLPAGDVQISETQRTQIASPNAYASFITQDLPGQLSFLSLFAVGQSYYVKAAYADATEVIKKGIAVLAPGSKPPEGLSDAYFRLGWLFQMLNDQPRAIDSYTQAIELKPDLSEVYYNRGIARSDQGDLAGAIADYTQAIELKLNFAEAYNNRGIARSDQGDLAGAIADSTQAIELKPDFAEAYNSRGIYRRRQGDLAGAIADFIQAIELKPDFAEAYNNRGATRSRQGGDLAGAIADYTQAIELKPDLAEAYYNRGLARSDQGDMTGAIADFTHAIELKPDLSEAYYNRGVARYKQGDLAGVITDFTRAIEVKPDLAEAYNNRGIARRRQGDLTGAIADFRRYLEVRPDATNRQQVEQWITDLERQPPRP